MFPYGLNCVSQIDSYNALRLTLKKKAKKKYLKKSLKRSSCKASKQALDLSHSLTPLANKEHVFLMSRFCAVQINKVLAF